MILKKMGGHESLALFQIPSSCQRDLQSGGLRGNRRLREGGVDACLTCSLLDSPWHWRPSCCTLYEQSGATASAARDPAGERTGRAPWPATYNAISLAQPTLSRTNGDTEPICKGDGRTSRMTLSTRLPLWLWRAGRFRRPSGLFSTILLRMLADRNGSVMVFLLVNKTTTVTRVRGWSRQSSIRTSHAISASTCRSRASGSQRGRQTRRRCAHSPATEQQSVQSG